MAKKSTITKAKYDSTHTKAYFFKLHLVNDADIIERLDSVESRQGYIKQLIRKDLAGSVPEKTDSVPKNRNITGQKYHIKPEYLHLWGSDATAETVVNDIDIDLFSADWGKTKEELLEQLIQIDE